jgi:rhodanese-related sulfurtransferase
MIWILLAITLIVAGWYAFEGRWDRRLFRTRAGSVCINVHPQAAKILLEAHPETQVLDVRSASEFERGALPNAIHFSFDDSDFAEKLAQLDKHKPVLVYCAGGYRSRKAVKMLLDAGFTNIQHLHRGYLSWQLARMS